MKLIVDRIEGEYVVCEKCDTGEMVNLEKEFFPTEEIISGTLFDFSDDKTITILPNDEIQSRIEEKMNNLWK